MAPPEDVSEAIRTIDLPGSGPALQVQRDSVRAVHDYLVEHGSATATDIRRDVYPEFEDSSHLEDDTADSWWTEYVAVGLNQLSTVEKQGDTWTYRDS